MRDASATRRSRSTARDEENRTRPSVHSAVVEAVVAVARRGMVGVNALSSPALAQFHRRRRRECTVACCRFPRNITATVTTRASIIFVVIVILSPSTSPWSFVMETRDFRAIRWSATGAIARLSSVCTRSEAKFFSMRREIFTRFNEAVRNVITPWFNPFSRFIRGSPSWRRTNGGKSLTRLKIAAVGRTCSQQALLRPVPALGSPAELLNSRNLNGI